MLPSTHPSLHSKQHLDRFSRFLHLHSSRQKVPILYNLPPHSLLSKLSLSTEQIRHQYMVLGPARVHDPNNISIGLMFFAGLTILTNRQTTLSIYIHIYIYTPSVTTGRIYEHGTAMWPKNRCFSATQVQKVIMIVCRKICLLYTSPSPRD